MTRPRRVCKFPRVPQQYTPQSLLQSAFTAEEFRYLSKHTSFREAAANVETLADFEYACEIGNQLIVERAMYAQHGWARSSCRVVAHGLDSARESIDAAAEI